MQQKTPVNGTYLIPSTGVFYDSLHHQRTNQMHDKCCDPRNHTLSQHHICRPFCAKFSLDRCNCRNTWCIQQAEDQRLAAATGVIAPVSSAVLPKSTESVDTTLSFAINPVISAVEIFQFPKPSGRNTGAMIPATTARILSWNLPPHSCVS